MAKTQEEKLVFELKVLAQMFNLYCKKHHQQAGDELCADCSEVYSYAEARSKACRFRENKVFCLNCSTHCYKESMRERIRVIMRYSGPRMLFHHPLVLLQHMLESSKEKKARKQAS